MKKITDHIFTHEFEVNLLPGVTFPTRSIFVELENNELILISPGKFDSSEIQDILRKYRRVYGVAPNNFHHLFLKRFTDQFPEVDIYGPKGVIKKQPWLSEKLKPIGELPDHVQNQIGIFRIAGNSLLSETVFHCRKSNSLIATDLFFNMRNPMPIGRQIILRTFGAYNKVAQSGLVKMTTKDKTAYKESVEALLELKCERILIAHGEIIEGFEEVSKALKLVM